jgi:hypothetical protein
VARYDKYDPISGGFRAPLAADWAGALGVPVGVGLDANGRVVPGAGASGVLGVVVIDGQVNSSGVRSNVKRAGDVVDVMTAGEIVDNTGLAAGTKYYADGTAGAVGTDATDAYVGHTVEAQRLVVRFRPL